MTAQQLKWFVPKFDGALNCWLRIATVEIVWTGAGYKVQVVPTTNGDVPTANLIAAVNDLLIACELGLEWLDDVCTPNCEIASPQGLEARAQIEAAIKKAKNET